MRLVLAAIGRLKPGPERDLFDRYVARARALVRTAGVTGLDLVEIEEGRSRSAEARKREEAAALSLRLPQDSFVIALDERGISLPSSALAETASRERDAGRGALTFAVGGPDGFADTFRSRADLLFAFGSATIPHQLVRILVAEQVYRALTIIAHHPYHRA